MGGEGRGGEGRGGEGTWGERALRKITRKKMEKMGRAISSPLADNPRSLQTTDAALCSQRSKQTVPYIPPTHTSTLPAVSPSLS